MTVLTQSLRDEMKRIARQYGSGVLSFPSAPAALAREGALYYNTTDHKLYVHNGTDWAVVGTQT